MTAAVKSRRDPAVVRLQLLLATRGFPPGPIDGIHGPRTDAAIRSAVEHGATEGGSGDPGALLRWLEERAPATTEVPRVTTPLSSAEVAQALKVGHFAAFHVYPISGVLRMARAHLAMEHFPDGRAIHVYNLGNVMAGANYVGPWFQMKADEELGGKRKEILSRWRAYESPSKGAAGYWDLLARLFPDALRVMIDGTPEAFARALKNQRDADDKPRPYYSAKLGDYAELMRACWKRLG